MRRPTARDGWWAASPSYLSAIRHIGATRRDDLGASRYGCGYSRQGRGNGLAVDPKDDCRHKEPPREEGDSPGRTKEGPSFSACRQPLVLNLGGLSILSHRQDAIRGPGLRPFEGAEIARRRKWTGVGLRQLERRLYVCERPSVCIAEDRLRPTDSHTFDVTSR